MKNVRILNECGFEVRHLFWNFYTARLYSTKHQKHSIRVIVWFKAENEVDK